MPRTLYLNIENATLNNNYYRKVLYTDKYQQVVVMSLNVGEDIHLEIHHGTQFFRIEEGTGMAAIAGKRYKLEDGMAFVVPPNTKHYVKNTSTRYPLKLYTIYSPPQHPPGTIDRRKPLDD